MRKIKQPLFKLSCLSLALAASFAQATQTTASLDEIRVTDNAVPTKITHRHLDQRVATDLKQAMKDQVGLTISGGNGVAQYYSIRGMGEDKITIDIDGTTNSSSVLHHQGRFILDPSLTKVINVEKGAGAASAGLGALAGVVRVTTVDAADLLREGQSIGLKVGASASSNRSIATNVAAYADQNGFDFLVAGSFVKNDNYKDGHGDKNYGSKLDQNAYLVKLGYDFNQDHHIHLSQRQEFQRGRRLPTIEFAYDPAKEEKIGESDSAQRQRTLNLEYQGKNLGFISSIDANVFRSQVDDYKPPKDTAGNSSTSIEITKNYATGANLNLASDIGKHQVKYGVNYRMEKAKSSDKSSWWHKGKPIDPKKHEYGVYVEGIWDLEPVILNTGLRYDGFKYYDGKGESVSHGQLNPSLGVLYSVTPNLSLVAHLNQASRAPRLVETLLASERFTGFSADKNLKAETARRAEIGFKWEDENFSVSANLFKQHIKDLVIFKGNKNKPEDSIVYNDGTLKLHGYEIDASYRLNGFKARFAVSESKPKIEGHAFKNAAQEDPYYFWNTGRQWLTSLSYRFENPSLEIGWTGRYFQKVHYFSSKSTPNYNTKAGYGVHDIFVNWQPLNNDQFNINLGVNNLFNKYYRSQSQRGNTGFYERGREFVAGFNYTF